MANTERTDEVCDVVLVGGGIMSATLGSLLADLAPDLRIRAFERLPAVALESTDPMNNAGTGHAANCELNYTPQGADGTVDTAKALAINEAYELSLAYWSSLRRRGDLPEPATFINAVPHMSLVSGAADVDFLRRRHEALASHPFFASMLFTTDRARIAEWAPLVMQGRAPGEDLAATRVDRGTDVDFAALTSALFGRMTKTCDFGLALRHQVTDLRRAGRGGWRVSVRDLAAGDARAVHAGFVFLGAGGGALPLLQRSGIPEAAGYGGFPVSGQWLVCRNDEVAHRHGAKVYGKASVGAPPMSVPHLDTRLIAGRRGLLFGPYAGFSTKFLKTGSYLDLPLSLRPVNLVPMVAAGAHNAGLVRYLVGQLVQSPADRLAALREYFPEARAEDWELATAGQRVQIIKRDPRRRGKLEFGTEVVSSADGSIAALLGASPGASTAVQTMLALLDRCFGERARTSDWQARRAALVPWYGTRLADDPARLARVRAENDEALALTG